MAAEQFANLAATTLNGAINNAVTTVVVASGAAPFPSSAQFRVVVDGEIMLVTAGAGTASWTVTRGAESTTAASHADGAAVTHVLTAGALGVVSDPGAAVPGLRTLGTGATQAAGGTDSRLSDSRAPNGSAGGSLTGTYPNPTIASSVVTSAMIVDGTIVDGDINSAAAIANTKLATNPLARANHTGTQTMSTISDAGSLATKSAVASADITDGTIVDADINASAAIAATKISGTAIVASNTIANLAAPAADFSMNTHKITSLTNGSAASDAAAFGQIPTTGGAASGLAKIVRRTSDATAINSGTTGTTLTSDDTLLWAMAANEIWLFNLYVIATTANLTMDLKVGMTGPASATADWGAVGNASSAIAGWGASATGGTPAELTISGSVGVGGANNGRFIVSFAGIVVNSSTSGNLNMQFAQNTADASNLVIKANSCLVLWRIA